MKNDLTPEMNKKYNTIAAYVLVISAIILLAITVMAFSVPIGAFFSKLLSLLNPFFIGFALAYILCPVCNFFNSIVNKLFAKRKCKAIKKHLGLVITYLLFFLCVSLFFYIIIPQITTSVNSFMANYKTYIGGVQRFFNDLADKLRFISPDIVKETEKNVIDLLNRSMTLITDYSPKIFSALSGVAVGVWNVVLGTIISIYMLSEKEVFIRQSKKLTYAFFARKRADYIIRAAAKTHTVFGGFVNGKLLDALIIGILCFIGLSILQMPYTALISVIVGVTDFIPYFGPFLGGIPSFIIVFLNDPIKALWFAVFILVLQQIDGNLIGPKILKETIGISSFWIIFSLLVMGGFWGLPGMILAVPIFALFHMALGKLCNTLLAKKGHPEKAALEAKSASKVTEEPTPKD